MNKVILLARKLKALADRGVDGEKINAEKMLQDFMLKHSITLEDIEGDKIERFCCKVTQDGYKLFAQIVASVNVDIKKYGPFSATDQKKYELTGNYFIECTYAEYVEIETKISIYVPLFKAEFDVFYYAFLMANDLLLTQKEGEGREATADEIAMHVRAMQISSKLKSEKYRKQLGA